VAAVMRVDTILLHYLADWSIAVRRIAAASRADRAMSLMLPSTNPIMSPLKVRGAGSAVRRSVYSREFTLPVPRGRVGHICAWWGKIWRHVRACVQPSQRAATDGGPFYARHAR